MTTSIRSALMLYAALTAAQVAPAQVTTDSEPLIASGSGVIPAQAIVEPIATNAVLPLEIDDPLLPKAEPEQPAVDPEAEANAQIDRKASLAEKVAELRGSDPGSREMECLAVGIYFEAKSESLDGQLAVGHVIANRAESRGRFPSSYCGVLFQRGQFSFVRGKSYPSVARSSRQWQNAVAIAKIVDQELHASPVPNALFFHARYVSPGWRMKRVGSVGNHIFYR
jgi:N-acetylmuramoyl-L-alanine amidase